MSRTQSTSRLRQKTVSVNDRTRAVTDVLFFSMGQGAIVIDEHGNIARVNKVALEILGYEAEELIGKWYPNTLIAEDDNGNIIPNIERPAIEAFLSGKPVFKRIYYRKKNGQQVALALTVSPIIINDRPTGTIELFRDITDEIQLEQAKDEFISIASHQLRTPATIVKQYLGMLIDGYVDSKKAQTKMLKVAYEHNNRQLHIINDLLRVAHAEAHKLEVVRKKTNLVNLLNKIISTQKADYVKKRMKLQLKSELKSLMYYTDPLHIQMVLENIINNAYKYSPAGSTVTVSLGATPKKITIKITDEGIGIGAKDISKLFKKFSRVENINYTVDGTGLGLYWAKKLIELHGGRISVLSQLGKGTTFSITMPREEQS